MKKLNKKGFTLVELLAVIVVIALVLGLVTYSVINVYKSAKTNSYAVNEKGVLEAARLFANEDQASEQPRIWYEDNKYEYFCTSVQELKNYGLLKKEIKTENIPEYSFIYVGRNKETKTIDLTEITTSSKEERNSACATKYAYYVVKYYKNKEDEEPIHTTNPMYSIIGENIEYKIDYVLPDKEIGSDKAFDGWKIDGDEYLWKKGDKYPITLDRNEDGKPTEIKFYAEIKDVNFTQIYYLANKNDTLESGSSYKFSTKVNNKEFTDYRWIINKDNTSFQKISVKETNGKKLYSPDTMKLINGTDSTLKVIANAEWKCVEVCDGTDFNSCSQDKCVRDTYSVTEKLKYEDLCGQNNTCSAILAVNWEPPKPPKPGNVIIKYAIDGEEPNPHLTSQTNYIYFWKRGSEVEGVSGYKYIKYKNSETSQEYSDVTQKIKFGGALSNNGLFDYNNTNYLNISKPEYFASKNKEWKCIKGDCISKTCNQEGEISHDKFCDASAGDCEVVLAPNWEAETASADIQLLCGTTPLTNYSTTNGNGVTWINKNACSDKINVKLTYNGNNLNDKVTFKYNYSGKETFGTDLPQTLDIATNGIGGNYTYSMLEGARYGVLEVCNKSKKCASKSIWFKYDKTPPSVSFYGKYDMDGNQYTTNDHWQLEGYDISNIKWKNYIPVLKWRASDPLSGVSTESVLHSNGVNKSSLSKTMIYHTNVNGNIDGNYVYFTKQILTGGYRYVKLEVKDAAGNSATHAGVYFKYGTERICTFTNNGNKSSNSTTGSCIAYGDTTNCGITFPTISKVNNYTIKGWVSLNNPSANPLTGGKTYSIGTDNCRYQASYESNNPTYHCYLCGISNYQWKTSNPGSCRLLSYITSQDYCKEPEPIPEEDKTPPEETEPETTTTPNKTCVKYKLCSSSSCSSGSTDASCVGASFTCSGSGKTWAKTVSGCKQGYSSADCGTYDGVSATNAYDVSYTYKCRTSACGCEKYN